MARPRKGPWRRGQNGHWYTTLGKRNVRVADKADSYEDAFRRYVELLNRPEPESADLTIAGLVSRYLEWLQSNRSSTTYLWYKRYTESFVLHVGKRVKVDNLKPFHVQEWINAGFNAASDNTKHGLIRAVLRPINWGVKNGLLNRNPIVGIEKPTRKPREAVLNEEQFGKLLSHVPDQEFRDYLCFMWETGCRPQEIRVLESRHRDGERIILEASNSKGEKYNRVIYLNDAAGKIFARMGICSGPIFRNSLGRPWTANSVRCRFRTLKRKMAMPELCANTLRHSWATNALKNGMDSTTASILMGHRDPSTLIRNYQHLTHDSDYLAKAAQLARSPSGHAITEKKDRRFKSS